MQFPTAIKLLQQRRDEIVRQMDFMLTGIHAKSGATSDDFEKVYAKYREVNNELEILKQL